jgi:NTP pyrophosphatase (non-canonical NTP hydrolase)
MKTYRSVEMDILQWAEARGIVMHSTAQAQAVKTLEELAELFAAISKGDKEAQADAYGDILVTLIIGCACADMDLVECLNKAYEEIKDRKGKLGPDGVFVKDAS